MYVIVGVFIALFVALILLFANSHARLSDARSAVESQCGEGGAVTYDVEGQNMIVYACWSDGKLKTRSY